MDERSYWLGFSAFPGIGPVRFNNLLTYFGTAKKAWCAGVTDLLASGLNQSLCESFDSFRRAFQPSGYAKTLAAQNVQYLILTDEKYPPLLEKINNPPFVLYIKGKLDIFSIRNSVAVVGTRNVTEYGKHVTRQITEELAAAGCVIVSGLALGVDSVSHEAAVRVGGRTIAVLGCGVDCCTPRENEALYI